MTTELLNFLFYSTSGLNTFNVKFVSAVCTGGFCIFICYFNQEMDKSIYEKPCK